MTTGASKQAMKPRWLDDHEQQAWRGFLKMYAQVNRSLREQLQAESELSLSDYEILVCLSEADGGTLRSYQIADQVQWEASRLSHQLRRMEARGLVARRECPTDGRGVSTVITARGQEAIDQAAPRHVDVVRRVFIDRLDAAQLDALIDCAASVLSEGT